MNLTSLQTALKRYGFDATDPLTDWLNAALHAFEDAYPWPWLEARTEITIGAGVNTIPLPADFYKLQSLKIDGIGTRLEYLSIQDYEDAIDDETTTGLPSTFSLVGTNSIVFWPTTDASYTFRIVYRKFIPDLVNGVDVPQIPTRHHFTIVKGAAATALQAESEESRARDAQNAYDDDLLRAISRWGTKQEFTTDTVRDTSGYFEDRV